MIKNIDCLIGMRELPDASFDSIVTDPPYELGFMGKSWDTSGIAYSVEMWREALRVLKPGGHLLAFSGSRTYHRMTCAIEDAGFQIRDCVYWHYGSGFPKSHNLDGDWKGWGTALKPSTEPVCVAQKEWPTSAELDTIDANLLTIGARLWLLHVSAKTAGEISLSNQPERLAEMFAIAQWTADELTSTSAALSEATGMLLFEWALATSLSTVSSWRSTLAETWKRGNTSIIETKSSTTTDWSTLSYCSSAITLLTIIQATIRPAGPYATASPAERFFLAELSRLTATLERSAVESVTATAVRASLGVADNIHSEHIAVARKPLAKGCTVAANILAHGTGAINVDGCRVPTDDSLNGGAYSIGGGRQGLIGDQREGAATGMFQAGKVAGGPFHQPTGRWPANLITSYPEDEYALRSDVSPEQRKAVMRWMYENA